MKPGILFSNSISRFSYQHNCIRLIIIMIVFQTIIHAQGWQWQNPLPQGNRLEHIQFIDSLNGWISTHSGTILRTTDGGNIWSENIIGKLWVQKIFFIDPLRGWCVGSGAPPFIMKTMDGGKTWEEISLPTEINITNFYSLWDIFFTDYVNGFLVDDNGDIFHTADGGGTWENQYMSLPGYDLTGIFFLNPSKGFAIGGSVNGLPMLITTNGGGEWSKDSSVIGILDGRWHKIKFIDTLHGWVSTLDYIYRTTNGGDNWTKFTIDNDVNGDYGITDFIFLNPQIGWASTGRGLYKSLNGGVTWIKINAGMFKGIHFFDSLKAIGTSERKYLVTTDGGYSWETNYASITENTLYEVDFIDSCYGWAVGTGGEIINTIDGGNSWQKQNSSTTNWLRQVEFWNKDIGWIVGFGGIVLRTTNGGLFWDKRIVSSDYYLEESSFINTQKGWAVGWSWNADTGIVLSTTNGGLGWVNRTPSNIGRLFGVYFIDSLKGWIASGGGAVFDIGEVYKTVDGGITWTLQISKPDDAFGKIIFVDSLTGWIASNNGLLKTTDGGNNWEYKEVFKDFDVIWSFTFYNRNRGWANGLQGRFASTTDGGENWVTEPSRTSFTLYDVDFINENFGWSVGDFGIILHTKDSGITSIIEQENFDELPSNFGLSQNYPNPFNPSTTINFSLPKESKVSLRIYDILGKLIENVIENEVKTPGNYQVTFNSNNLPSGVYFYTLTSGDFMQVRKMILTK